MLGIWLNMMISLFGDSTLFVMEPQVIILLVELLLCLFLFVGYSYLSWIVICIFFGEILFYLTSLIGSNYVETGTYVVELDIFFCILLCYYHLYRAILFLFDEKVSCKWSHLHVVLVCLKVLRWFSS